MNPPRLIHNRPTQTYLVRAGDYQLSLLGPADPDALLDDPETERRFYAENEHMPYWARPWAAARMLADFICRQPRGDGRRAIEIGCGLGLAGFVAAMHGWNVTLTDYEEAALDFARASAELNGIRNASFARLDWRTTPSEPRHSCRPAASNDLILASDVLFEARWVDPVAEFIHAKIGTGATWLSDPNRRTAEAFPAALHSRGLHVVRHAATATDFDDAVVSGTVYQISRNRRIAASLARGWT